MIKFIPCGHKLLVEEDPVEERKIATQGILGADGKDIHDPGVPDYLFGTVLAVGATVFDETKIEFKIGDRIIFHRGGMVKPFHQNKKTNQIHRYFLENERHLILDATKVVVKINE